MIKPLNIEEVKFIAHELAKETMEWNEPIPEFSTRYPNILESCIATPFQTFDKKQLYPGIFKKAAILFYLLIKNHPFQNGNKRIAVTTLFVFLHKNKKWMHISNQELYNFAVWIASSPPELKEKATEAIEFFIKKHAVPLKAKNQ